MAHSAPVEAVELGDVQRLSPLREDVLSGGLVAGPFDLGLAGGLVEVVIPGDDPLAVLLGTPLDQSSLVGWGERVLTTHY
jgi:hypothetical protein